MPCRNDGYPEAETAPAWMLCEAMVILERAGEGAYEECSQQLRDWWSAHKVKEEDRVRAEAAAKLTDRERLALGIDVSGKPTRTRVVR